MHLAKVWIEFRGKALIGPGGAAILQGIAEEKSISKAARKLGMSYRFVWGQIQQIQKTLGEPIVITHRGGKVCESGGGGAILTKSGQDLLEEYKELETYVLTVLNDRFFGR